MPHIVSWNEDEDGSLCAASMYNKMQALGYQATEYSYPPGCYFAEHSHSFDKLDGILSGCFEMTMQGETIQLQPGDMVYVPAGEAHTARVVGNESVISLDGVK